MRTIALRLTGTKSAKEALEELGEDTDAMLTTQSKLRDTIKEATAVASNNFKGFDILDDNGNYKSTYEIMLGIADVYDEILETDKQLGRNNANLLLESVAGKTRANIAASIFQNPQLLKDAYKSSQDAENSAMEENEKYMNSINGHIAQLQNAYQQMWANSMNRDTVNYFIDLGKSILQVVDNVGLLGTAFVGITGIKSIVGYQNGKGFAYEIITGSKNAIKYLAANEGAMQSLASTAISAGKAIKGSFSAAIPVIGSVGTAIALVAVAVNAFAEHQRQVQKELVDFARTAGEEWKNQKQSLSDYSAEYEELKNKLDSGDLSEQETIETKQKIYDIQKQITEQYTDSVDKINLINGELQEQLNILNNISEAEANRIWNSAKYQKGFELAKEAMTTEKDYALSQAFNINNTKTPEDEKLSKLVEQYTEARKPSRDSKSLSSYRVIAGTPVEAEKQINELVEQIEKLKEQNSYNEKFQKRADDVLSYLNAYLDEIGEIRKNNEPVYLEGLPIELMATKGAKNYKIYSDYQSSVSNLEDAYISGNNKKIKEARINYEEATKAKEDFLNVPANNEFSVLFDNIDTSIVDTKIKTEDATKAIKKSLEIRDEINRLDKIADPNEDLQERKKSLKDITKATGKYTKEDKKLYQMLKRIIDLNIDKVDAERAFDASANGSQVYRYALENLMNALGYTIDDSSAMIDMLITAGVVHGDVTDATYSATDAYNQFSQEVATAIENVSKLNTVLTESVSGAGISTQNIDAFKEMFGDDYVYALERSANGYHINAEKLQTLTDKQKALINADFQNTLDAQYDALKRCNDEIASMNSKGGQDTSGLLSQREKILQRIQDTQDLMMAYEASTSAYQTWVNAQSNGNEYDMYDKIANGYDTVKDLIDRGWSGDDTVRSYLDLVYGDSFDAFTASGEECAEMFDNLDKKIEGTSFSIHDFFQFDASGKLTSNGIFNFFDAVKEKQKELGEDWLTLDENGNITDFNFGLGGDREVAEALGLDAEFLQSILRAAVSAGFELNLDQPIWAMNKLEEKAIAAQEELGGFNNIDFSQFNEEFLKSDEAYETLSGHVSDVYDYIQEIENNDELAPDVKTDLIENAQDMLAYLVALEREAADKGDIDLKIEIAENATNSIKQLVEETENLPKELAEYNWDSITDAEGLEKAKSFIEELEGTGAIDTSTAETFLSILYKAIDQLDIIDNYEANPTFEDNTVEAYNKAKQGIDELRAYLAVVEEASVDDIEINFNEDAELKNIINFLTSGTTPEIRAGLKIDNTAEEMYEILEMGYTDLDVILHGNVEELRKDIDKAGEGTEVKVTSTQSNTREDTQITHNITDNVANFEVRGAEELAQASQDFLSKDGTVVTSYYDVDTTQGEENINKTSQELTALGQTTEEANANVDNSQGTNAIDELMFKGKNFNGSSWWGYANLGGNAIDKLNVIDDLLDGLTTYKSITIETFEKTTKVGVNGTAHAQGTAFSRGSAYTGGKWGLPNNQTALTGELGTEIVVRDGNWFTVGEDGAEFVNLKKGDINKIVSIYSDVYIINHLIAGNP